MSQAIFRHKVIILAREAQKDDSLRLTVLTETGEFLALKIPGVMKSTKRSSFHYYPGAIYHCIYSGGAKTFIVPRSFELEFTPFAESQDYARLSAVAELVRLGEYVRSSPETPEFFNLLAEGLERLPDGKAELDLHLDAFYWAFLQFLGLAGETGDEGFAAYDLAGGFLTERELAARAGKEFLLPASWVHRAAYREQVECDAARCREIIRRYLADL